MDVQLLSSGDGSAVIDAERMSRVFTLSSGAKLIVNGLTVANGWCGEDESGGTMAITAGADVTFARSVVVNSTALSNGGAFFVLGGSLTLSDGTVVTRFLAGNSQNGGGGAAYVAQGTLIVSRSTIEDGSARWGGAFVVIYTFVEIFASKLEKCRSVTYAGTIGMIAGSLLVHGDTIISSSSCAGCGGLMSLVSSAQATFVDCLIFNSTAGAFGGCYYILSALHGLCTLHALRSPRVPHHLRWGLDNEQHAGDKFQWRLGRVCLRQRRDGHLLPL